MLADHLIQDCQFRAASLASLMHPRAIAPGLPLSQYGGRARFLIEASRMLPHSRSIAFASPLLKSYVVPSRQYPNRHSGMGSKLLGEAVGASPAHQAIL